MCLPHPPIPSGFARELSTHAVPGPDTRLVVPLQRSAGPGGVRPSTYNMVGSPTRLAQGRIKCPARLCEFEGGVPVVARAPF